ncbi:tryptophan 7-halogenase [Thalassotalea litorea]|uniref:Tryptophan 7-halogenase n=1 Tax=Thalassotalea litorea TaxID=2020715 RepID=A0A5R9IRA6_9GAMM|nr:tryptophan halogenase family protein [Thalassotalea litorea]TLU67139.1 tryptophan 7-halogenase [Thalassotalea litorea]
MNVTENPIKKFVIVGGGTAGWIAAATLSKSLQGSDTEIELVESDEIGIIGVGEATIPPLLAILESLNIDLAEFIKATQSTFKWGIKFEDWNRLGESYFHPFGTLGRPIDGNDFYQCWLKSRAQGDNTPLMAHSPEAVLSEHGKFFLPFEARNTPLQAAQYALHLDSGLVGKYLRTYAESLGVKRTEGMIECVQQHPDGAIKSVELKNGKQIGGDFFIDCSGFRGLLIGQTLGNGYEDWSEYLPCDRAVTLQTKGADEITPYTIAKAQKAGWTWRIPLQHRTGNGYVYCSKHISDEEATETLLNHVEGEILTEPKVIPFTTGIRDKAWDKNCLALGLAQGFLEPLESTAIHLVSKTMAFFLRMLPDNMPNQVLINEFNRRVKADYEEIRDFLVLHYCLTERDDSPFWQYCKDMPIPASLQQKIDFFNVAGGLIPGTEVLFQATSWYAVFDGMGVVPSRYNPVLDAIDYPKLKMSMDKGKQAIVNIVQKQPTHRAFIEQYCPAKDMPPG